MLTFPSMKDVTIVDWAEEDGIDIDLSALYVASRNVTMSFAVGDRGDFRSFYAWLKGLGQFTLEARELGGVKFKLRLLSQSSLNLYGTLQKFSLRFSEDNPWELVASGSATRTIPSEANFSLDGVSLSDYNIRVLKDTKKSLYSQAELKEFLTRSARNENGQTYDENPFDTYDEETGAWSQSSTERTAPKDKTRDFTVQCLMTAPDLSTFWANYSALFHALVRQDDEKAREDETTACVRRFSANRYSRSFKCYYKGQTLLYFFPDPQKIWAQFSLTLGSIDGEGEEIIRLLTTEGNDWVITESGLYVSLNG